MFVPTTTLAGQIHAHTSFPSRLVDIYMLFITLICCLFLNPLMLLLAQCNDLFMLNYYYYVRSYFKTTIVLRCLLYVITSLDPAILVDLWTFGITVTWPAAFCSVAYSVT